MGWTDVQVARRLGVSQGRYSSWVNDVHEPDYATLVRIAAVLQVSTDEILGVYAADGPDTDSALRDRALVALRTMSGQDLSRAVAVLETLASIADKTK
jgi:transcriptional regulator with XRE-family HTH domain